jgi:hypothetical protein
MPALTLTLSLLLATAPAASETEPDRVRYQRQSSSSPRIHEDVLGHRLEQARRAQPREADELAADPADQFRKGHGPAPDIIEQQIEFMETLLTSTPEDDAELPDYLFRLADLYLDDKAHHDLQAAALEEQIEELETAQEVSPPGSG